jgi:cytochrome P450
VNPQIALAAADFFAIYRSMLRDESIYPDASTFRPERFMEADPDKKKLMDPRNYVFGFGRR